MLIQSVELRNDSIVLGVTIDNASDRDIRLNASHSFVISDDARGTHRLNPPADNPELRVPAKVRTGGELVFIGPLAPAARQLTVTSNAGIGTPDNPHDDTPLLRIAMPAPSGAAGSIAQADHPNGVSLRISRIIAGSGGCVVSLSATNGNDRPIRLAQNGALQLIDENSSEAPVATPPDNRDLTVPPGQRLTGNLLAACGSLKTSGMLTLAANRGTGGTPNNPFETSPLLIVRVQPQPTGDIPAASTAATAPIARSHLNGATVAAAADAPAATPKAPQSPAKPPATPTPAPTATPAPAPPPAPVAAEQGRVQQLEAALHADSDGDTLRVTFSADDLFGSTGDTLTPQAEARLAPLEELIQAAQSREVTVAGYTDASGSDDDNRALSERRSKAVGAWLDQHAGKRPPQVSAAGYGRTRPVAANHNPDGSDNPEGRAKNRRIEITLRR